ncbi:DNA-binding GntR family transcriptional regulator [Streptomyces albaduncus]|uniref:DNA-binding GntR family transcriptional regulator n=1 Tax=Streptomyces griseoloalbus TaxID=67303 RepID=A0A7W8BQ77_9ACTN|nr:DNA-binding GntR family transcriptional regulator [Streptomyces albaduncus]
MRKAVAGGEPLTYSELNHELHVRIREFSGQRTAVALLERLNAQLVRHRFQLALRPGRPPAIPERAPGHDRGDRARDPQAAEAAVRAHLTRVIEALRD